MELNGIIEKKLRILEQKLNEINEWDITRYSDFKNSSVENFQELEKINTIQSFDKYADMIRFRNFVIHRYEHIDTNILFTIVTKKLQDFSAFIDEIRKYGNRPFQG